MKYINEIICFYDWLETNPIGSSCIALWHALLHTWQKAGCPEQFAVPISILEAKTGIKKDTIYETRNKLKQLGRVDWIERKGNQSVVYKLNLFNSTVGNSDTNTHTNTHTNTQAKPTQIPTINSSSNNNIYVDTTTINNVPKIPTQTPTQIPIVGNSDTKPQAKQEQINFNAFKYYEQHYGLLRSTVIQEIKGFLNDGIEETLIIKAIDRSFDNGVNSWAYARSILDNCLTNKILNVEDFEAKETLFKLKQRSGKNDKHSSNPQSESEAPRILEL